MVHVELAKSWDDWVLLWAQLLSAAGAAAAAVFAWMAVRTAARQIRDAEEAAERRRRRQAIKEVRNTLTTLLPMSHHQVSRALDIKEYRARLRDALADLPDADLQWVPKAIALAESDDGITPEWVTEAHNEALLLRDPTPEA